MSTVQDKKLHEKMEKDRLALERRKDIVYNGGGTSYDKKIVRAEENRVRRRYLEKERMAKKGRISASSSTLDKDNEADYGERYDYDDPMSAGDDQQPVTAQRVQTVHNRICGIHPLFNLYSTSLSSCLNWI
ncbi:hypothetical protein MAM1_0333c09774 [Mucor ambiguus]|uniref:IBB domain-containing protein n=1 Tax=Mucor ambiguus TaxID=91626 RepID=A0A0C9MHL4_9FUNG|nr:hypothetical protein MAM1_0333c09774 [Mucor ambiguus]